METTGFLEHPGSGRIFFRRYGQGGDLVIALHGFGKDSRTFSGLGKMLLPGQCLYALDLPWHGQTRWEAVVFTPKHLHHLTESICHREEATSFTALGFSYGARLWLGALPVIAPSCNKVILLSPEGIANRWQACTSLPPLWLRQSGIFRHAQLIAGQLRKAGLLRPFTSRFIERHLQDPALTERLQKTWNSLAFFPVQTRIIRQALLTDPGMTLTIAAGEKDPLLHLPRLQQWTARMPGASLLLYPAGHDVLPHVAWDVLYNSSRKI